MRIREGLLSIAQSLQEAEDLAQSNVRALLRTAVYDAFADDDWCCFVDHTGDGVTGTCIYETNWEMYSCPYTIGETDGKMTVTIDTTNAKPVAAIVTYRDLSEAEAATRKASKATKASESAGKPAGVPRETLQLTEGGESCGFLAPIPLNEAARSSYPIKIISPGTGSTAHYPADVLERDGPKVFKKGTLMFWNHQTTAEANARPEGDLNDLAAIMTKDAWYDANGAKGPGLYSEAKVMADYGEKVETRAPHIGLSIRAGGSGDGTKVNGKPVLKSIDYVESVDYVTKAGRGGLALAEAARDAGILPVNEPAPGENMDVKETSALINEAVRRATAPLLLNEARRSARDEGMAVLENVTLPEAAKTKIVERAVAGVIEGSELLKEGVLDVPKFHALVVTEATAEAKYLGEITGSGRVVGMGPSAAFDAPLTEAEVQEYEAREERRVKQATRVREAGVDVFARLTGGNRGAAVAAVNRGGAR